jgi:hypothetical protein
MLTRRAFGASVVVGVGVSATGVVGVGVWVAGGVTWLVTVGVGLGGSGVEVGVGVGVDVIDGSVVRLTAAPSKWCTGLVPATPLVTPVSVFPDLPV